VNGAQVGILEETNQVGLRGFLESSDGRALEAKIGLEVLSNFTDETLEGELTDQKLSRLLELTNLTKSDSSGSESVGLLDASRGSVLTGLLGGVGLAGSLTSGGLTSLFGYNKYIVLESTGEV
jgi:hypothetical protein